jgi:predicted RNA-binding Zn-ribbon protein involved in translation (DUF1610 family)
LKTKKNEPLISTDVQTDSSTQQANNCPNCGAELPESALFCSECGKPKEGIHCTHCDKLSIFDFCPDCGKPVTEEAIAELQCAQDEMLSQANATTQETTTPDAMSPKTFSSNQVARRWYNAYNPSTLAQTAEVEAELAKLELLINSDMITENNDYDDDDYVKDEPEVVKEEPVRKSLLSDRQMSFIRQTGADIDAEQNRRRCTL